MAKTPNYGYEKRQRELAKKKQQDEKRLKKRGNGDGAAAPVATDQGQRDGGDSPAR